MVEVAKFKSNFGKHKVPEELLKLCEFQEATGFEDISDGFCLREVDTTGLSTWSTEKAFLDSFIEFAEANGSGSTYALWVLEAKPELSKQPVVVFGDEGGVHVVADNLKAFLRLISFDTEPLVEWDDVSFYKDPNDYEPSSDLDDYIEWLADVYNLKPVKDPDEILKPARKNHGKKLKKWLSQFIDDIEADDDDDDDSDEDSNDSSAKRRFEFEEGNSSKFWEIQLDGESLTTWWGKIGTTGQSKTLDFDSEEEAEKQYEKLVAEKTKKGYEEVSGSSAKSRDDEDDDNDEEDERPKTKVSIAAKAPSSTPAKAPVSAKPVTSSASTATSADGKRRFEFEEGNSSKFWEVQLDGGNLTTWWGKIGTAGQSKTLALGSAAEAQKQYDKLVAEKTKKGYEEVE